jgi:hypothetical protein
MNTPLPLIAMPAHGLGNYPIHIAFEALTLVLARSQLNAILPNAGKVQRPQSRRHGPASRSFAHIEQAALTAARTLRNMALFVAAPFIGLAYAVALPFVGLTMLALVAGARCAGGDFKHRTLGEMGAPFWSTVPPGAID